MKDTKPKVQVEVNSTVAFIVMAIIIIAAMFLNAYFTMLLWNLLIPTVFGGPMLTYWQSFGLGVLLRLFYKMISADVSD